MPSTFHCKHPRLIEIAGECCKEWTCPVQHDEGIPDEQSSTYNRASSYQGTDNMCNPICMANETVTP